MGASRLPLSGSVVKFVFKLVLQAGLDGVDGNSDNAGLLSGVDIRHQNRPAVIGRVPLQRGDLGRKGLQRLPKRPELLRSVTPWSYFS